MSERRARNIVSRTAALAVRAAELSKCDLVTLMVGDSKLGELQGIIGGHYARLTGESEAVCAAIAEHYQPRGADDAPPPSMAGRLVSIADKIDNLAACFRLGLIPSGSADPFALRRQCQGVISTLVASPPAPLPLGEGGTAHGLRVQLPELLAFVVGQMPEPPAQNQDKALAPEAAVEALLKFFGQRLETACEARGVEYDVIRAVLAVPVAEITDTLDRAVFLSATRKAGGDFDAVVTAATRPANIVASTDAPTKAVDPALFEDDSEKALYEAYAVVSQGIATALAGDVPDYGAAWQAVASLAPAIDRLFVAVMVMAEDAAVRENRLALLRDVDGLFRRFADLREIVQAG